MPSRSRTPRPARSTHRRKRGWLLSTPRRAPEPLGRRPVFRRIGGENGAEHDVGRRIDCHGCCPACRQASDAHYGCAILREACVADTHQPVDDLEQSLLLVLARGLPRRPCRTAARRTPPAWRCSPTRAVCSCSSRPMSSASRAIDVRRRAVASRNRPRSASSSLRAAISSWRCVSNSASPALEVQQLPALDAMQLFLERQHAACHARHALLMLTPPPANP